MKPIPTSSQPQLNSPAWPSTGLRERETCTCGGHGLVSWMTGSLDTSYLEVAHMVMSIRINGQQKPLFM